MTDTHDHSHAASAFALAPSSGEKQAVREKSSEKSAETSQEKPNWFARNRWFTHEPISYTAYQFFRSTMATIPYGFGMAFFHHVFGVMSNAGVKMGLTEAGQQKFYSTMAEVNPTTKMAAGAPTAVKALDAMTDATRQAWYKPGTKGLIGRSMMRFANSPINAALQIGLGFSMFRFVGGLVKNVRDKVMSEENTVEDTNRETKNWWQSTKDLMKINWKAEAVGTFWGGLTLGFIGALVHQTMPYKRLANEGTMEAIKRVLSKPAKLLQNGAIWAISYSAFFEVDERIQKDVKLREGTWKGHENSLINKPDPLVGKPPSKDDSKENSSAVSEKPKYSAFTEDPGLLRLWLRRILPVAVGITLYAVLKRSFYVLGGGQMQAVTPAIKTARDHGKLFLGNSWREGLATATFGILWACTDAWGEAYDKFFTKLQGKGHAKPATEPAAKLAHALPSIPREHSGDAATHGHDRAHPAAVIHAHGAHANLGTMQRAEPALAAADR